MRPSEKFNLHPSDHQPSELASKSFDVICIGSGWAGNTLATRMIKAGYTALVVESELFGGDCPFWACVPSKVLLRPPEVFLTAKETSGAKERINGDQGPDVQSAFKRRDVITMGKNDTLKIVPLMEGNGVTLVRGTGKLVGVRKVEITPFEGESVVVEARLAVALCNGSEPVLSKNIKGLREADPWTPRDATSADYVPEHLIVMGAGAVGCEMATAYRRYGSKVTVFSHPEEILPAVDNEAGKLVRESLESEGVVFHLGVRASAVERPKHDQVEVHLDNGDKISGTELLVAAGRQANLGNLGLDSVGVKADERFLKVDESLCVKTQDGRWLYAAGDINGRAPLTHSSKYHAAIVANAIITQAQGRGQDEPAEWSDSTATADNHALPQVIFTDPVVASVGLTRKAAQAKNIKFREVTSSLASSGYNVHVEKASPSWAQWLLDDEDRLIGATFVGTDAAELLHGSTVAIVGGVKLQRLMHAIPSFPSLTWVYYNLMDAAGV